MNKEYKTNHHTQEHASLINFWAFNSYLRLR